MVEQVDLHADIGEVLLGEEEIQTRVAELGRQISADYAGKRLTLVSVLKGSLPFMADLMRVIDIPVRIDLMEVSSYGGKSTEVENMSDAIAFGGAIYLVAAAFVVAGMVLFVKHRSPTGQR